MGGQHLGRLYSFPCLLPEDQKQTVASGIWGIVGSVWYDKSSLFCVLHYMVTLKMT